jgi:tetratricopeptide (TPR) repeat protein
MIMDNADDPSFSLLPYIAQSSRGNIIITTRNPNQAMHAPNSSHHLEGLSMEDAISLLLTASGNEDTKANRALAQAIVEELGRLPLALAQAAGYIFVHKCLSTYLVLYRQSAKTLLAERPSELPYHYQLSVDATIKLSLYRLPTHALHLLQLFSHLDSTSISHAIISRSAERKFRRVESTEECDLSMQTREQAEALVEIFCTNGEWSEVEFNRLIRCCLQYSLLRVTTRGDSNFYSMHILVQSYLRANLHLIQGHKPGPLAVRLLGSSSAYRTRNEHLAFDRLLLPHLRQITMKDVVEAGDHFGFGHVMESTGDSKSAVLHFERCLVMWRGSLGEEHMDTLSAMVQLALSYKSIESIQKALDLEEEVLDIQRTTLGEEHLSTLETASNLANSYRRLDRYKEAMELGEKVLEAEKRALGPEDVRTLITMDNLALSYRSLGRNREALGLQKQALEIWKRVLGPEDPYALRSMCYLAESYRIVGRRQEALELSRQALDTQKRVLGDEHPDTLRSILDQLRILHDLGMTEQLRDLLRVTLPAHEKVLGLDHPNTVWIRTLFRRELTNV